MAQIANSYRIREHCGTFKMVFMGNHPLLARRTYAYCTYGTWYSMLYSSLFSVHYCLSHIYGPFGCRNCRFGNSLSLGRDDVVLSASLLQGVQDRLVILILERWAFSYHTQVMVFHVNRQGKVGLSGQRNEAMDERGL